MVFRTAQSVGQRRLKHRDALRGIFDLAVKNLREAYDGFTRRVDELPELQARHERLRSLLETDNIDLTKIQDTMLEIERRQLSLNLDLHQELEPKLKIAAEVLAKQVSELDESKSDFARIREEFARACRQFEIACTGQQQFESSFAGKLEQYASLDRGRVQPAFLSTSLSRANNAAAYGDQASNRYDHQVEEAPLDDYPELKALYNELLSATQQLNEINVLLGSYRGQLVAAEEKIARVKRKVGELADDVEALLTATQRITDEVASEATSVYQALDQVAEVKEEVSNACLRLRETTSLLTTSIADIDNNTGQINSMVSMFTGKSQLGIGDLQAGI